MNFVDQFQFIKVLFYFVFDTFFQTTMPRERTGPQSNLSAFNL